MPGAHAMAVLDANFRWTRELFSPLAPEWPLLYMQPRDFRTARQAGWGWSTLLRDLPEGRGITARRYAFPPGWFSRLRGPFLRWLARDASRWLREHRAGGRVLTVSYPHYAHALRLARPDLGVYYWSDEFRSYWPGQATVRLEHEAVAAAGLTVCCSRSKADQLRAELPEHAHKVMELVHGHHLGLVPPRARKQPAPAPEDISDLPRPLLGHWGQVSGHTDLVLAQRVAEAFPHASLVFLGPVSEPAERDQRIALATLRRRSNVRFLGSRPYEAVASYLPSFDVCLALYRPELPFTRVTNPSKIRDYIASTRPCVTTALPDARTFWDGLVRIAETHEAYVAAVGDLLAHPDADRKAAEERLAYAREHTWGRVASRFAGMVHRALGEA